MPDYPALYREFAEAAECEREAHAALEGAAWFEATFAKSDTQLLQPIDDAVNYAVVVQAADPWTLELAVEKYWKEPDGYLGMNSQTLRPTTRRRSVSRPNRNARRCWKSTTSGAWKAGLNAQGRRLTAMQNDWLDGDRADPRLFRQGPLDRFATLAQQLEGEVNPYWNTDGEQFDEPEAAVRKSLLAYGDAAGERPGRRTTGTCPAHGRLSQHRA